LLNPDRGVLVYLGGTPGLRGFRENQFAGTRSLLLIVEERKFLSWRVAGFIQPGLAAFAEVGALAGGLRPGAARAVHGDAGVGLRFANAKASGPSVVKVDLAIPIGEAWKGGRAVRLVIGFRREL
jgi:hemolysin activation/secretion protein